MYGTNIPDTNGHQVVVRNLQSGDKYGQTISSSDVTLGVQLASTERLYSTNVWRHQLLIRLSAAYIHHCTHRVAALFCVKRRHGRHLESVTSNYDALHGVTASIDAYYIYTWTTVLTMIHPGPILNDGDLGFFVDRRHTTTRRRTIWVAIWLRLVPDANQK